MRENVLLDAYAEGTRSFPMADLRGATLIGVNLTEIDLRGANLCRASLIGTNLSWARLSGARLHETCLHRANLHGACLNRADLIRADLTETSLYGADLRQAKLNMVGLRGADLRKADLRGAFYSPLALLTSIDIGVVSPELTAELMKWDAEMRVFGGPSFALWAVTPGGSCPFVTEHRAFHFTEDRAAWDCSPSRMSFPELFRAVMAELRIKIE